MHGLDLKGSQQLKDNLIQLGECHKFASAHPAAGSKCKLHRPLQLGSLRGIALQEPLRTKDFGIGAKYILRHHQAVYVVPDGGPAGQENTIDGVPSGRDALEMSIQSRRADSNGLVYHSLATVSSGQPICAFLV